LRLVANRDDDASFERVVNTPTRGIGDRSVDEIRQCARRTGMSLWQAAQALVRERALGGRATNALSAFIELIERLADETRDLALGEQVGHVVNHSGLIEYYEKDKGEKGRARVENLEELANAARQYETEADDEI